MIEGLEQRRNGFCVARSPDRFEAGNDFIGSFTEIVTSTTLLPGRLRYRNEPAVLRKLATVA